VKVDGTLEDFSQDAIAISSARAPIDYVLKLAYGIDIIHEGYIRIENISITDCELDIAERNWGYYNNGNLVGTTSSGRGINIIGVGDPDHEVEIEIKNNIFRNCFLEGMLVGAVAGRAVIEGNDFKSGNLAPDYFYGLNGIITSNMQDMAFEGIGKYQPGWSHHFVIENNDIECGPNTSVNDWVLSTGIGLHGQAYSMVKNNRIKDEGGYDCIELTNDVDCVVKDNVCSGNDHWDSIALLSAYSCIVKDNNLVAANPMYDSIFLGGPQYEPWFETVNNLVIKNEVGPWGIGCGGNNNKIVNNTFVDVPEWYPFVHFFYGSGDNSVVGSKNSTPPHGFDVCDNIWDQNYWYEPFTSTNKIPGYERCDAQGADVVAQVEARKAIQQAKHEERKATKDCKRGGGYWDSETKTCVSSEEGLHQKPRSDRGRPPKGFVPPGQQ
jgi:hypothetical protein